MSASKSRVYASPKIARQIAKSYGNKASFVKVSMRSSEDVKRFVKKVESAHKRTAKSKLKFDS